MIITGTLRIRPTKKGKAFEAEYQKRNGKNGIVNIQPNIMYFDQAKAVDGDSVELEWDLKGTITRCSIPGKEAEPAPPKTPTRPASYTNSGRPGQGHSPKDPPLTNATAPYNFIPYEPRSVLQHVESTESPDQCWSGVLQCSLEALTPLLVAGPQARTENGPARKDFFTVNGRYVIPGSSIKGMLRSFVEVLSFSHLRPMNTKSIFWRAVVNDAYRGQFQGADEPILGGYLIKRGAKYRLVQAKVQAVALNTQPSPGKELVKTGNMGNKQHNYIFARLHETERDVPDDVADDFLNQRTPAQITKWNNENYEKRITDNGIPVFYNEDNSGKITALGLCRYFRLKYVHTPADFAPDNGLDFARVLFGATRDQGRAGRVAVGAALVTGEPDGEYPTVLGQPHPTCLAHYLVQNSVKRSKDKNKPETFTSYNDELFRLRGRKWYWHRDLDVPKPPNDNTKVHSTLCPLQAGATASFQIRVDRVTSLELGALFEALELVDGHAHKLGLGKSMGLGSVRLTVDRAEVRRVGERYASLGARLGGHSMALDGTMREEMRAAFRNTILHRISKQYPEWKEIKDYEDLPPIKALRLMMDFNNKPDNVKTKCMTVDDFKKNSLLPTPEQILNRSAQ